MNNQLAEKIKLDLPSISYREEKLGNGLNLIMCRSGNIPMTAINTTVHAGSKDEEETKTGVAHLFEHLMFEGSPNIAPGKFDEVLTLNGGESNAYTTWDTTSYQITVPSNKLELALWLDSDRFTGFAVNEESLEIQKEVVLEEKLMYTDNSPYGSVEEESSKCLFKSSGYKNPIIGNMDDVKKLSLNDLRDFFEKHYIPGNMTLTVVGDIDFDETYNLVSKYYGDIIPKKSVERKDYHEDTITSEIRKDIYDNIHLDGKFIFYRLPEAGSKEYYAMSILNGILSEGDSSRFYKELEYKSQLVNECDSSLFGFEKASVFIINALALKGKSLDEVEMKIDNILMEIVEGKIDDDEITKIKNRIETIHNSRIQSIVSLADRFSYLKTIFNNCELINLEILDYLAITKNDIVNAAKKYLNSNQRVVLNYYPKKQR